jgi:DNA (cytosine-5)-methyltransferase 1
MKSIELFTGAGGIALGLSRAGFSLAAVCERDATACATIRENTNRGVVDWPLVEADIASVDFSSLGPNIDLLAGGPPCQPFSVAGSRRAQGDDRNLFPEIVRVVRELAPKAILIENVPGLLRGDVARYFNYVLFQLRFPELERKKGERWPSHATRLKGHAAATRRDDGLSYDVKYAVLHAADFGVPQRRERVFIVGYRRDLDVSWEFPAPTHSLDALLWAQWVTSEYWDRHGVRRRRHPEVPTKLAGRLARVRAGEPPTELPWRTVRDAISDLPAPATNETPPLPNHVFVPGARAYNKHTGSPMDFPAKTLKAGAHGVPGGENMVVLRAGEVRYFTIRECARLQTFPDDYTFTGTWKSLVRQLGNAVPVRLTEIAASRIREQLMGVSGAGINGQNAIQVTSRCPSHVDRRQLLQSVAAADR